MDENCGSISNNSLSSVNENNTAFLNTSTLSSASDCSSCSLDSSLNEKQLIKSGSKKLGTEKPALLGLFQQSSLRLFDSLTNRESNELHKSSLLSTPITDLRKLVSHNPINLSQKLTELSRTSNESVISPRESETGMDVEKSITNSPPAESSTHMLIGDGGVNASNSVSNRVKYETPSKSSKFVEEGHSSELSTKCSSVDISTPVSKNDIYSPSSVTTPDGVLSPSYLPILVADKDNSCVVESASEPVCSSRRGHKCCEENLMDHGSEHPIPDGAAQTSVVESDVNLFSQPDELSSALYENSQQHYDNDKSISSGGIVSSPGLDLQSMETPATGDIENLRERSSSLISSRIISGAKQTEYSSCSENAPSVVKCVADSPSSSKEYSEMIPPVVPSSISQSLKDLPSESYSGFRTGSNKLQYPSSSALERAKNILSEDVDHNVSVKLQGLGASLKEGTTQSKFGVGSIISPIPSKQALKSSMNTSGVPVVAPLHPPPLKPTSIVENNRSLGPSRKMSSETSPLSSAGGNGNGNGNDAHIMGIGFSTGRGKAQVVSSDAIARAKMLMSDADSLITVSPPNTNSSDAEPPSVSSNSVSIHSVPSLQPSTVSFSTGRNKAITVSASALSRAKSIFAEDTSIPVVLATDLVSDPVVTRTTEKVMEVIPSVDAPLPKVESSNTGSGGIGFGFTTGNMKKVVISEEARKRAQIFVKEADNDIATAAVTGNLISSSGEKLREEKKTAPLSPPNEQSSLPSFSSFSFTTGRSKQINVSAAAIEKAKSLFKEEENVRHSETPAIQEQSTKPSVVSPVDVVKESQKISSSSFSFTTGRNKKIEVSAESIQKAKGIFDSETTTTISLDSSVAVEKIQPLATKSSCVDDPSAHKSEEVPKSVVADVLKDNVEVSSFGFSTGRGKKQIVSKESMERAKMLMSADPPEPTPALIKNSYPKENQTGGKLSLPSFEPKLPLISTSSSSSSIASPMEDTSEPLYLKKLDSYSSAYSKLLKSCVVKSVVYEMKQKLDLLDSTGIPTISVRTYLNPYQIRSPMRLKLLYSLLNPQSYSTIRKPGCLPNSVTTDLNVALPLASLAPYDRLLLSPSASFMLISPENAAFVIFDSDVDHPSLPENDHINISDDKRSGFARLWSGFSVSSQRESVVNDATLASAVKHPSAVFSTSVASDYFERFALCGEGESTWSSAGASLTNPFRISELSPSPAIVNRLCVDSHLHPFRWSFSPLIGVGQSTESLVSPPSGSSGPMTDVDDLRFFNANEEIRENPLKNLLKFGSAIQNPLRLIVTLLKAGCDLYTPFTASKPSTATISANAPGNKVVNMNEPPSLSKVHPKAFEWVVNQYRLIVVDLALQERRALFLWMARTLLSSGADHKCLRLDGERCVKCSLEDLVGKSKSDEISSLISTFHSQIFSWSNLVNEVLSNSVSKSSSSRLEATPIKDIPVISNLLEGLISPDIVQLFWDFGDTGFEHHLCWDRLVSQLLRRYQNFFSVSAKGTGTGYRSPIERLTRGDVPASSHMVLQVLSVQMSFSKLSPLVDHTSHTSVLNMMPSLLLELTDGYNVIEAAVHPQDTALSPVLLKRGSNSKLLLSERVGHREFSKAVSDEEEDDWKCSLHWGDTIRISNAALVHPSLSPAILRQDQKNTLDELDEDNFGENTSSSLNTTSYIRAVSAFKASLAGPGSAPADAAEVSDILSSLRYPRMVFHFYREFFSLFSPFSEAPVGLIGAFPHLQARDFAELWKTLDKYEGPMEDPSPASQRNILENLRTSLLSCGKRVDTLPLLPYYMLSLQQLGLFVSSKALEYRLWSMNGWRLAAFPAPKQFNTLLNESFKSKGSHGSAGISSHRRLRNSELVEMLISAGVSPTPGLMMLLWYNSTRPAHPYIRPHIVSSDGFAAPNSSTNGSAQTPKDLEVRNNNNQKVIYGSMGNMVVRAHSVRTGGGPVPALALILHRKHPPRALIQYFEAPWAPSSGTFAADTLGRTAELDVDSEQYIDSAPPLGRKNHTVKSVELVLRRAVVHLDDASRLLETVTAKKRDVVEAELARLQGIFAARALELEKKLQRSKKAKKAPPKNQGKAKTQPSKSVSDVLEVDEIEGYTEEMLEDDLDLLKDQLKDTERILMQLDPHDYGSNSKASDDSSNQNTEEECFSNPNFPFYVPDQTVTLLKCLSLKMVPFLPLTFLDISTGADADRFGILQRKLNQISKTDPEQRSNENIRFMQPVSLSLTLWRVTGEDGDDYQEGSCFIVRDLAVGGNGEGGSSVRKSRQVFEYDIRSSYSPSSPEKKVNSSKSPSKKRLNRMESIDECAVTVIDLTPADTQSVIPTNVSDHVPFGFYSLPVRLQKVRSTVFIPLRNCISAPMDLLDLMVRSGSNSTLSGTSSPTHVLLPSEALMAAAGHFPRPSSPVAAASQQHQWNTVNFLLWQFLLQHSSSNIDEVISTAVNDSSSLSRLPDPGLVSEEPLGIALEDASDQNSRGTEQVTIDVGKEYVMPTDNISNALLTPEVASSDALPITSDTVTSDRGKDRILNEEIPSELLSTNTIIAHTPALATESNVFLGITEPSGTESASSRASKSRRKPARSTPVSSSTRTDSPVSSSSKKKADSGSKHMPVKKRRSSRLSGANGEPIFIDLSLDTDEEDVDHNSKKPDGNQVETMQTSVVSDFSAVIKDTINTKASADVTSEMSPKQTGNNRKRKRDALSEKTTDKNSVSLNGAILNGSPSTDTNGKSIAVAEEETSNVPKDQVANEAVIAIPKPTLEDQVFVTPAPKKRRSVGLQRVASSAKPTLSHPISGVKGKLATSVTELSNSLKSKTRTFVGSIGFSANNSSVVPSNVNSANYASCAILNHVVPISALSTFSLLLKDGLLPLPVPITIDSISTSSSSQVSSLSSLPLVNLTCIVLFAFDVEQNADFNNSAFTQNERSGLLVVDQYGTPGIIHFPVTSSTTDSFENALPTKGISEMTGVPNASITSLFPHNLKQFDFKRISYRDSSKSCRSTPLGSRSSTPSPRRSQKNRGELDGPRSLSEFATLLCSGEQERLASVVQDIAAFFAPNILGGSTSSGTNNSTSNEGKRNLYSAVFTDLAVLPSTSSTPQNEEFDISSSRMDVDDYNENRAPVKRFFFTENSSLVDHQPLFRNSSLFLAGKEHSSVIDEVSKEAIKNTPKHSLSNGGDRSTWQFNQDVISKTVNLQLQDYIGSEHPPSSSLLRESLKRNSVHYRYSPPRQTFRCTSNSTFISLHPSLASARDFVRRAVAFGFTANYHPHSKKVASLSENGEDHQEYSRSVHNRLRFVEENFQNAPLALMRLLGALGEVNNNSTLDKNLLVGSVINDFILCKHVPSVESSAIDGKVEENPLFTGVAQLFALLSNCQSSCKSIGDSDDIHSTASAVSRPTACSNFHSVLSTPSFIDAWNSGGLNSDNMEIHLLPLVPSVLTQKPLPDDSSPSRTALKNGSRTPRMLKANESPKVKLNPKSASPLQSQSSRSSTQSPAHSHSPSQSASSSELVTSSRKRTRGGTQGNSSIENVPDNSISPSIVEQLYCRSGSFLFPSSSLVVGLQRWSIVALAHLNDIRFIQKIIPSLLSLFSSLKRSIEVRRGRPSLPPNAASVLRDSGNSTISVDLKRRAFVPPANVSNQADSSKSISSNPHTHKSSTTISSHSANISTTSLPSRRFGIRNNSTHGPPTPIHLSGQGQVSNSSSLKERVPSAVGLTVSPLPPPPKTTMQPIVNAPSLTPLISPSLSSNPNLRLPMTGPSHILPSNVNNPIVISGLCFFGSAEALIQEDVMCGGHRKFLYPLVPPVFSPSSNYNIFINSGSDSPTAFNGADARVTNNGRTFQSLPSISPTNSLSANREYPVVNNSQTLSLLPQLHLLPSNKVIFVVNESSPLIQNNSFGVNGNNTSSANASYPAPVRYLREGQAALSAWGHNSSSNSEISPLFVDSWYPTEFEKYQLHGEGQNASSESNELLRSFKGPLDKCFHHLSLRHAPLQQLGNETEKIDGISTMSSSQLSSSNAPNNIIGTTVSHRNYLSFVPYMTILLRTESNSVNSIGIGNHQVPSKTYNTFPNGSCYLVSLPPFVSCQVLSHVWKYSLDKYFDLLLSESFQQFDKLSKSKLNTSLKNTTIPLIDQSSLLDRSPAIDQVGGVLNLESPISDMELKEIMNELLDILCVDHIAQKLLEVDPPIFSKLPSNIKRRVHENLMKSDRSTTEGLRLRSFAEVDYINKTVGLLRTTKLLTLPNMDFLAALFVLLMTHSHFALPFLSENNVSNTGENEAFSLSKFYFERKFGMEAEHCPEFQALQASICDSRMKQINCNFCENLWDRHSRFIFHPRMVLRVTSLVSRLMSRCRLCVRVVPVVSGNDSRVGSSASSDYLSGASLNSLNTPDWSAIGIDSIDMID